MELIFLPGLEKKAWSLILRIVSAYPRKIFYNGMDWECVYLEKRTGFLLYYSVGFSLFLHCVSVLVCV